MPVGAWSKIFLCSYCVLLKNKYDPRSKYGLEDYSLSIYNLWMWTPVVCPCMLMGRRKSTFHNGIKTKGNSINTVRDGSRKKSGKSVVFY